MSGIAEHGRIIRIGESAITSSPGDWIGVGEVISTKVEKASFCGTGEISIASCDGKGDDGGSGGVVIQSAWSCKCLNGYKVSWTLPRFAMGAII
jgi:hypothetical protein